jgi:transposase
MWKAAQALRVSRQDRELLSHLARAPKTPQRIALRAKIVIGAAAGRSINGLAKELSVTRPTILLWRRRYVELGVDGLLKDAPRPGRKKKISAKKVETIVNATLQKKPKDATHWSTRTMARAQGVSEATVRRIWKAHGLRPHRAKSFKLSRDPEFVKKLRDVVGLYLNPPDKALVLCVDEKSQIQALDRTQPALPMRTGNVETRTHDYVRHGTTTLFAALNVLEGTVIGSCKPRHRHQEFLEFMAEVDRKVPKRREIHLILDNYGTHKHPKVKSWFDAHPRYHLHFVPTSSSWLNLIERWFAEITRKEIRRGTFRSVRDLIRTIVRYLRENNKNPQPFIWTASAASILRKVRHCKEVLDAGH